jgi:hypothetical protein
VWRPGKSAVDGATEAFGGMRFIRVRLLLWLPALKMGRVKLALLEGTIGRPSP